MNSRRCHRSGVFAWSPTGIETKGLIVAEFAQHFDPTAGATNISIDFVDLSDLLGTNKPVAPTKTVECNYRFNDLAWAPVVNEKHPSGIVAGGTENGTVVFFDAHKLAHEGKLDVLSSRRDHHGHVLSVDYSSDKRWLMSGGGGGQLLLWDLNDLSTPFSPGTPNSNDQVKVVKWNKKVAELVCSLSSHRASLWDLRRNGAPIIEFAEVGGGCDWSDMAWHPNDASTIVLCSQAANAPLLQKWDVRYPTAPVKDYPLHRTGVTSVNWHPSDSRLLLSASHDGQLLISNPDSGEVVGSVGCEQGDWVRRVSWSEAKPDLMAVQYFQHPIQMSSINALPVSTQEESTPRHTVQLSLVPAWVSAAPVGTSFALGGSMAKHYSNFYREWDEASQSWKWKVDIRKLPVDENRYQEVMELQNAIDARTLPSFALEKGLSSKEETTQLIWTFLSCLAGGEPKKNYLRALGFPVDETSPENSEDQKTDRGHHNSYSSSDNTGSPRNASDVVSHSEESRTKENGTSEVSSKSDDVHSRLDELKWENLDDTFFSVTDKLIAGRLQEAVMELLGKKDYVTAMALACGQGDRDLWMDVILQVVKDPRISQTSRLISMFGFGSIEDVAQTATAEEWKRSLGLILSQLGQKDGRLVKGLKGLASEWRSLGGQAVLRSALPSIMSGDVAGLLVANKELPIEERMQQAVVLRHSVSGGSERVAPGGEAYDELLLSYCERLIEAGLADNAWRLIKDVDTQNENIVSLRYSLYEVCGGRERTQAAAPTNPYESQSDSIAKALRGQAQQQQQLDRRQSVCPPAPGQPGSLPGQFNAPPRQPGAQQQSQFQTGNYQQNGNYGSIPPYGSTSQGAAGMRPPAVGGPPMGAGGGIPPPPSASSMGVTNMAPPPMGAGGMAPPPLGMSQMGACSMAPPNMGAPPVGGPPMGPMSQGAPPLMGPPGGQQWNTRPMNSAGGYESSYGNAQHSAVQQQMRPPSVASSVGGWNQQAQPSPVSSVPATPNAQAAPPTSGWNDPPPLPGKKVELKQSNVMQVQWKALEPAAHSFGMGGLPGARVGAVVHGAGAMGAPPIGVVPPGMQPSPQSSQPSPQQQQQQQQHEQQQALQVQLSADDQAIVDSLNRLADMILASNRAPVTVRKAEEAKHRIATELMPRLAHKSLSEMSRNALRMVADFAARGDFPSASQSAANLVRTGVDFGEVSTFMPALKSLISLAQSTFRR